MTSSPPKNHVAQHQPTGPLCHLPFQTGAWVCTCLGLEPRQWIRQTWLKPQLWPAQCVVSDKPLPFSELSTLLCRESPLIAKPDNKFPNYPEFTWQMKDPVPFKGDHREVQGLWAGPSEGSRLIPWG